MEIKTCTSCSEAKPMDAFPKRHDGYINNICRDCKNQRSRDRKAQRLQEAIDAENAEKERISLEIAQKEKAEKNQFEVEARKRAAKVLMMRHKSEFERLYHSHLIRLREQDVA